MQEVSGKCWQFRFCQTVLVPLSDISREAFNGVPIVRPESVLLTRGGQPWTVASISGATIWRWLNEDAIKPWTHRSWIFPRDPDFEAKAGRVLDLYARQFEGRICYPTST